jgi:hypothetical protein
MDDACNHIEGGDLPQISVTKELFTNEFGAALTMEQDGPRDAAKERAGGPGRRVEAAGLGSSRRVAVERLVFGERASRLQRSSETIA